MNKREKSALCQLLAEWEYQTGGGSSEAAARGRFGEEIKDIFGVTEADLAWDRAWEVANLLGDTGEDFLDALATAFEADSRATADAIEGGIDELRRYLGLSP